MINQDKFKAKLKFVDFGKVARETTISIKTLRRWEKGESKPRPIYLKILCDTLEWDINDYLEQV